MKFKCRMGGFNMLTKHAKITLVIPDEEVKEVAKHISNFKGVPLVVEMLIDEEKQKERLMQITEEQRKKIYAFIRDIANYIGDTVDNTKENLKIEFVQHSEYEMFSLSNCSSQLASDFIDFLINFAFENGVPMSEHPLKRADDIERYLAACLKHGVCCVCGQPGEIHHVNAIGIGRDRTQVDDSEHEKMCLCRKHHSEFHTIGKKAFCEKYHVHGVKWEGR